jgi:hypothetical protein
MDGNLAAKVYAAADALLFEAGSLSAVTLDGVEARVGGRRQNVARFFNGWRADRESIAAAVPRPVLRAAARFAGDLWLLATLAATGQHGSAGSSAGQSVEDDQREDTQPVESVSPKRRAASATAADSDRPTRPGPAGHVPPRDHAEPHAVRPGRFASLSPMPIRALEPKRSDDFIAGRNTRKSAKQRAGRAVNARPEAVPKKKRGPTRPPPPTAAEKAARAVRAREFVLRARAAAAAKEALEPVAKEIWRDAADPAVARAAATELRRARRPLRPKALIEIGNPALPSDREALARALAGSRLRTIAGGGYWFAGEDPPLELPEKHTNGPDTDEKILFELGGLMWLRVLSLISASPKPVRPAEIKAQLQPEISYLNREWLTGRLADGKKAGVLVKKDGGYLLAARAKRPAAKA